jgi:hypothetical protein
VPKKAKITQERVEYNVFLFDEPLKGSKSLKIFKISLTFRFDKLSNLSKSVHTGENSQILTVSNKKCINPLFTCCGVFGQIGLKLSGFLLSAIIITSGMIVVDDIMSEIVLEISLVLRTREMSCFNFTNLISSMINHTTCYIR